MAFVVADKMFGGQLFGTELISGGIERMIAATGFSGRFLEVLGALPPEVLVLLDTAHIWGPPVTLVCFLLFGPLAGANRLLSRNAQAVGGVGGGPLGVMGRFTNRACFAFSTAVAIRQVVLWFAGLAPVKGALLSLGVEIIPARTGALAAAGPGGPGSVAGQSSSLDDASGVAAPGTAGDSRPGSRRSSVSVDPRRACFASAFGPLSDTPTVIDKARASGVVQVSDYLEFKERMAGMPERLPALERDGAWTEMMHKKSDGMSYRAWRHVLPYGGTEYLSRTVFQNATVEEMVDFFGCDDTRASWDRLLFRHRVLSATAVAPRLCFGSARFPSLQHDYVFPDALGETARRTGPSPRVRAQRHAGDARVESVGPYKCIGACGTLPGPDSLTASECILSHFEEQHEPGRRALRREVRDVGGGQEHGRRLPQVPARPRRQAPRRARGERGGEDARGIRARRVGRRRRRRATRACDGRLIRRCRRCRAILFARRCPSRRRRRRRRRPRSD